MGLSIAISGAIVMITIVFVLFSIPNIVNNIFSIGDASLKASDLRESISQTSTQIMSLSASSGSDIVKVSLANNGTEKLWDFDKFTFLVTYDADIGGISKKVTEEFSYNSTASFQGDITVTLRPDGDLAEGWAQRTNCAVASEWDCLEDTPPQPQPDNSDFVNTSALNDNDLDVLRVTTNNGVVPTIISSIIVNYTYGADTAGSSDPNLDVTLEQGATKIARWTEFGPLPGLTWGTFGWSEQSLTQTEIASITDFDDLNLNFTGWCVNPGNCDTGGGSTERVSVSFAEIEITGTNPGDPGEWWINNITNDIIDPKILNNDETAIIFLKLTNNVFPVGNVIVSITTNNGITVNAATAV